MKRDWLLIYPQEASELAQQTSVSEFLQFYYKIAKQYRPNFSYANLALKMGVSKSLVVGIFQGKKPITAKTYPSLSKVMSLPPLLEQYFEQLVHDPTQDKKLDRLRSYFLETLNEEKDFDRSVSDPDFPILYAGLSEKNGSTDVELALKTGWPIERVRFVLHELQLKKFVVKASQERWKGTKLFLSTIAKNQKGWLPAFFQSSLMEHQTKSSQDFFSDKHLSFVLSYCINQADFQAMNEELKLATSAIVQKYHNDEGDKIVRLILGTHQN